MTVKGFNSDQRKPVLLSSVSSHVEDKAIQPISRQPCLDLRGTQKTKVLPSGEERDVSKRRNKTWGGSVRNWLSGKEPTNTNCNSKRMEEPQLSDAKAMCAFL